MIPLFTTTEKLEVQKTVEVPQIEYIDAWPGITFVRETLTAYVCVTYQPKPA